MTMEEILTTEPKAPVQREEKQLSWIEKMTYQEQNPLQEAVKKQREEEFKVEAKNHLKKQNLYSKDDEDFAAMLAADGQEVPEELKAYQTKKEEALKTFTDTYNKQVSKELEALDPAVDGALVLPGASIAFNLGEVAFDTALTGVMDVIPESIKEKAPVLTNLGAIGAIILAIPKLRKASKKVLGEGSNVAEDFGVMTGAIDNTAEELAQAIKDANIDPKLADELLTQVNPTVIDSTIQPKTIEDVLVKHEKLIEDTLTKELKSITDDDINAIFGKPTDNVQKVKKVEGPKFDIKNINLNDVGKAPETELQKQATAIQKELDEIEKEVGVPVSISNKVDVNTAGPVQKNNTDLLKDKISRYDLTNNTYSGPGGRAAARGLLNKVKSIVNEVGFDKHISKWLDNGDIEAAYLRAEEIKANRNTTGIQRPGSPDYKPLDNSYVYAHAAPEIAGGLLGAGVAASQENATVEDIAIGFLLGSGITYGAKYMFKNSVKVTEKNGTTTATITEEVTTDRLSLLREARLEEVDVILKSLDDDLKFAGEIRAAKLSETKAIIEKVKEQLKNTESFTALSTKIKESTIRDMVKKTTKTKVDLKPKEAEEIMKVKASVSMKEGQVTAVNLNRIESEQDLELAFGTMEELYKKDLTKNKKSFAEVEAEAQELGFNTDDLNKLYADSEEMAAKIYAARGLSVTLGEEFIKIANKVDEAEAAGRKGEVEELLIELQNAAAKLASVQAMVEKSKGNIARATAAMRMTARKGDYELTPAVEIFNALGSGSKAGLRKLAKQMKNKQSLAAHDHLAIKGVLQPNGFNMIEEFYLNALLSNPATHAKNAVSNALTGIHSIFNKYAEAGFGAFSKDSVTFKEANAYAVGYLSAIKEAWKMAKLSKDKGEPIIDWIQKEEGMQYQAISKETLPGLGEFGATLGSIINTPFKALMVSDEFFKTLAYRAEFNASAVKHAQQEVAEGVLKSEDLGKRIAELQSSQIVDLVEATMDNTLNGSMLAMHRESLENARFLTHTKQLGEVGQGIQKVHQIPLLGKLIFPFIRTPINIVKYIGKHTPGINSLSEGARANFKAGGRARNKEIARMATGSALYTTGFYLSSSGVITGKLSDDQGQVASMRAAGIEPNSIKVGDTYYPYQGADVPFSFFKIMADFNETLEAMDFRDKETFEQASEVAAALTIAFAKMGENSTWMESMSQLMALTEAPKPGASYGDKAETFIINKISSLVPAIVYGLSREEQGVMVEAHSLVENLRKRIPGLSDEMPIKYDMYGQPVKHSSGLLPKGSETSPDPVKREIARIKYKAGWTPRKVTGVELTPEQRSFIMKTRGEYFYSYASQLVNGSSWENLEDGTPQVKGGKHIILDKYDKVSYQMALLEAREKFKDLDEKLSKKQQEVIDIRWGE